VTAKSWEEVLGLEKGLERVIGWGLGVYQVMGMGLGSLEVGMANQGWGPGWALDWA
jgi:hypothetical protein